MTIMPKVGWPGWENTEKGKKYYKMLADRKGRYSKLSEEEKEVFRARGRASYRKHREYRLRRMKERHKAKKKYPDYAKGYAENLTDGYVKARLGLPGKVGENVKGLIEAKREVLILQRLIRKGEHNGKRNRRKKKSIRNY